MYGRKRMAKFRPNSEIIGKFQKLKKFYSHFVGAYDFTPPCDRRLLMICVPEGVMMIL